MYKILCVEDSPDVVAVLEVTLMAYQLVFTSSVKETLELLLDETFSLILLDIELPDGSGLEIMATMSDQLQKIPVIFLTGKKDFASKVSAFSMGAEDFIVKPFDPKELKLRVDSKLKKTSLNQVENANLKIGSIVCNLQEQRLFIGKTRESIDLTSIEFRIFSLLARTPNKIFSREEILDRVWGSGVSVSDRAVDVHVSNLRKKLSETDVTIEAVIGAGYRAFVENKKQTHYSQ